MTGKIIKGIAGFYYVSIKDQGIFECKAKGVFRKDKKKPLVGDHVKIDVIDPQNKKGNIIELEERNNDLIRPLVANVDQAMVVFAITKPKPHFNLLDRFLVMMEQKEIPVVLVFNKKDIATKEEMDYIQQVYKASAYTLVFVSAESGENIELLHHLLEDKTTVIAGPSGVGKSSIINILNPKAKMETGEISTKIERGKHTTRHSELFAVRNNGYIMDTPGFSSLYVNEFEKEELKDYFPEFLPKARMCKFNGCNHIHEPKCSVREALDKGEIHQVRYESYGLMFKELEEKKRY